MAGRSANPIEQYGIDCTRISDCNQLSNVVKGGGQESMKSVIAIALIMLISVSLAVAEDTPDQVFRDLENRISHAVMTKDPAEMNKLFASDYTSIGVSGKIRSRAEVIAAYSSGTLAISTAHTDKIAVRRYGDIAIVVGSITVSGKEGSTDISGQYAFTRVYKRDSSEWLAVSFQATLVK
jgi:uncharacterized protein (TIGR02246 family)